MIALPRSIYRGCLVCALLLLVAEGVGAQTRPGRSQSIVNIDGTRYYVHNVKANQTLYSLARLYGVAEDDIIRNNPGSDEGLRSDQVLKIPVVDAPKPLSSKKMSRLFETHTVRRGETAYSISKSYGISVPTLLEDNPGLDPAAIPTGARLNIRKESIGDNSSVQIDRQWEDYTEALNSVVDEVVYHKVMPGETVYSLANRYGVSQADIVRQNDILAGGLKAGMLIKVPVAAKEGASAATDTIPDPMIIKTAPDPLPVRRDRVKEVFDEYFGYGSGRGEPRRFEGGQMNVALMLPLQGTDIGKSFLEFYQGALIAMQDLKIQGIAAQLNLYDTGRSIEKVREEVASYPFQSTDIVIGPVYAETLQPVLEFAMEKQIPVVSPLAQMDSIRCPLLYQLSPDPALKNDKLKNVLSPDRNVIVISASQNDPQFTEEITPLLPEGHRRFDYSTGVSTRTLEAMMRGASHTVLVVLAQGEHDVDAILARISSIRNNMMARGVTAGEITVVGSSRWQRMANLDRTLFFKLNVCYTTNYHADRTNPAVMAFSKRYITAFWALPSLYSYRGYDAVKLFVGTYAKGGSESFETAINLSSQQLLEMPYRFSQATRPATHINREWVLVSYKNDYTIEVR